MADVRIPDINQVMIAGRITRDPELRYLQNGTAICNFGIAHDRHYKDKSGEKKKETTFVDIEAWAKTAEIVAEYLNKGDPVMVEGRLKFDQWEDKTTGQKRSKLTVTANRVQPLSWKGQGGENAAQGNTAARTSDPQGNQIDDSDIGESDIPF